MSTSRQIRHPDHTDHPVHVDPIDRAIAFLVADDLTSELLCDGSCAGVASCTLAPVGGMQTAA